MTLAASPSPKASHAPRSSRRRAARSSVATVAARTSGTMMAAITTQPNRRARAELDGLDECYPKRRVLTKTFEPLAQVTIARAPAVRASRLVGFSWNGLGGRPAGALRWVK